MQQPDPTKGSAAKRIRVDGPRRHPRLLFAFGHGHIGFSTGPLTGRIIAALIADEAPPVPIAPFAIERFA